MADVGIDLGTSNTRVYVSGAGIVLDEPSVVAVERDGGKLVAVGLEAKRMLGRTPDALMASRPMRNGIIADVDGAERMLRAFLDRVLHRGAFRSAGHAVVCVPSASTALERRAVREAVLAAGFRSVSLITEPIAAAIGAGLPVTHARCSMVVNVGGGTTEVAVIALSGIVAGCCAPVGGIQMDEAITGALRKHLHVVVGEASAETLKISTGSALAMERERTASVTGRHLATGLPGSVSVDSVAIRGWIGESLRTVVSAVRQALERTPAELSADLVDAGMVLTGGGSLLHGFDGLLGWESGLTVTRDSDPLTTVVRGAGMVVEELSRYRDVLAA
jgi:rod shape-determining protein MreB and related proteins